MLGPAHNTPLPLAARWPAVQKQKQLRQEVGSLKAQLADAAQERTTLQQRLSEAQCTAAAAAGGQQQQEVLQQRIAELEAAAAAALADRQQHEAALRQRIADLETVATTAAEGQQAAAQQLAGAHVLVCLVALMFVQS